MTICGSNQHLVMRARRWVLHWSGSTNTRNPPNSDSMKGSLLGPCFKNSEIGDFYQSGYPACYIHDESLLVDGSPIAWIGKIVGWFHGAMSLDPSAWCSKYLGDPKGRNTKSMNLKIKFRGVLTPFSSCFRRGL